MAAMSQRRKPQPKALTEDQIDEIVTSQAHDESAWEEPVEVHRPRGASLSIPGELAARAAFLARLHRTPDVQEWVTKVLRERIELEEVAFAEAKREIAKGRT
jgi:hypothetical protein